MAYLLKIFKIIGIIGIVLVIGILVWAIRFAVNFHGDTYNDSERYIIQIDDSVTTTKTKWIVDLLYKFQIRNPEYQLVDIDEKGEEFHYFKSIRSSQSDIELIFFYFKDINKTVSCIVDNSNYDIVIKLYAVNEGVIFRKWKRINNFNEISRKENRDIKRKFETEILNQLGVKWKYKRWFR